MINIYIESDQVNFWLDQAVRPKNLPVVKHQHTESWSVTNNRVAMIELLCFDDSFEQRVTQLQQQADLLVLFLPELVSDVLIRKIDQPNVVFFIGGVLNYNLVHAQHHLCPYFFWSTADFYRACRDVLPQLTHGKTADKFFDVLLGTKKLHRDCIYQQIDHTQNIVKYFNHTGDADIRSYDPSQFQWPTEIVSAPDSAINSTVEIVQVDHVIVSLSQIVPVDIYNQTHYTWVAESQFDNGWSFFTEKIVKPILGKRLFVVTSGQHYLRNLRSLGFRTFESIIDETYDQLDYWEDRLDAVFCSVNQLTKQKPAAVSAQIQDIVDHNFSLMMNTDWQQDMISNIGNVLNRFCINIGLN